MYVEVAKIGKGPPGVYTMTVFLIPEARNHYTHPLRIDGR